MALRIAPAEQTYVCIDDGPGTEIRFEGILDAPQTFRGKLLRVNLGKTSVQLTVNGKAVPLEPSPNPAGFEFSPAAHALAAARRAALRLMAAAVRAGMVVTGTEVLTGRVRDRNGPWVSERLLELGVELAHVTICGDRPEDIEAQLRFLAAQGVDLILTSGGLGPTADDMTVEVVARFAERELQLDEPLEQRIVEIVRPLMERLGHTDVEAIRAANSKQALIPDGRARDRAGRDGAGRRGAQHAAGDRAAGTAVRAAGHVGAGARDAAGAGGAGRPAGLRAGDAAPVRDPRVGDRRDAAGRRAADRGLRPARDHDLPAPRGGRGGHALRAGRRGCLRGAGADRRRASRRAAVLARR